jgi:hypothetical protein
MKKIDLSFAAVLLVTTACAGPPNETAATSNHALDESCTDKQQNQDNDHVEMKVEDLDGDGVEESFTSTRIQCGTGGCMWKVRLSKLGEAGELFGLAIEPLPKGTDDLSASFLARSRGGACLQYLDHYSYEGGQYVKKASIDCHEVVMRPEGSPIAQFEGGCFDLVPPECRGR